MNCKYKDEQIIDALIRKGTVTGAAKELGMQRQTLYKRMKDKAFQDKFNEAKREFLRMATTSLQNSAQAAVATMHNIMCDETSAKQIRLNAASYILQYCGRFTEQVDIVERLERLEAANSE